MVFAALCRMRHKPHSGALLAARR
ncbi:hypothetical protein BN381_30049 [Candidatus Microthrix parvicella RN1]|uniref:Uncharacterized protein n=1 Tax=Candidatus Neomicrothrix parvicella RN1 TaxID=1229780 RepID=R4YZH1_9ACTN|nr:hypothetical protein BN381_30049 [Candidatus Microthrix parvicella RN1]